MLEAIELLLKVVDTVLAKLPNYDQKKREQFFDLRTKYENELIKDYPDRDDNLIDTYHDELLRFIKAFVSEISRQEISSLPE